LRISWIGLISDAKQLYPLVEEKTMNKAKAIFTTIIIQAAAIGIFLLGMLMDPLLGLWITFLYFSVVGTFLIYKYLRPTSYNHIVKL
jgi:fatty acid desaturase